MVEKQNLRILIFLIALSVHFLRGGHPNACRRRAGGGRGSKKAKKLRAHFMYGPIGLEQ